MKKLIFISVFVLQVLACKKESPVVYDLNNNIIAHRGAWKDDHLPQNSIASLKRAIQMNCAGSELDVWLTKDDTLIVEHDIKYAGKSVETNSYAILSQAKLSNGEVLPTLRQYLQAASGQNQTKLFLEIKTMSFRQEKINKVTDHIMRLVDELQMQDHVIYISFIFPALQRVHQNSPDAKTLFLGGTISPAGIQTFGFSGFCYDIDTLTAHPDWMTTGINNKQILASWKVNNSDQFTWLLNNKINYIITDKPNDLFRVLNKQE